MIEFYYNLSDLDIHKKNNDEYDFKYNNSIFYFVPLVRNDIELEEISQLIDYKSQYDHIVKNIYQQLYTIINNRKYILIEKSNIRKNNFIEKIEKEYITLDNLEIDHSNWVYLWSRKVDNIEYQMNHIENKFPILSSSINYYIGMAETAIMYVKTSLDNTYYNEKTISHIRYLKENFNNPQNIIIDYKSRDISEYLKYIFFTEEYSYDEIQEIFTKLELDEISLRLIYGRLFFPTFYFDVYDKIINNLIDENEIINIINKSEEYEDYLEKIYIIICNKKKIPKVTWI